jgi:hypothetical protein
MSISNKLFAHITAAGMTAGTMLVPADAVSLPELSTTKTFFRVPITSRTAETGSLTWNRGVDSYDGAPHKRVLADLAEYATLQHDWDGEGASAPARASFSDAEQFVCSLTGPLPEALVNANGRAGLIWERANLYVELEFLGNHQIAYYGERNGQAQQDIVNFTAGSVPEPIKTLIAV